MPRRTLNDRIIKAIKVTGKTKEGKPRTRLDVMDAVVPGFGIRVTDKGRRTFILIARIAGAKDPTRRELGKVGVLSLAEAREKARDWLELIRAGKDPTEEEESQRRSEELRRTNTFAAVAEDFIKDKLAHERKGKEIERDIRREFLPDSVWGKRPISDITDLDILKVIQAKKLEAPAQARNLLGTAKRLFGWAKDQRCYGLTTSPCADLKPKAIIGQKKRRQHTLSNDEMFALWRATKRIGYPYGPIYQLLALTALRLNEVADASLSEFDPALPKVFRTAGDDELADQLRRLPKDNKLWVIPAERMKGKNDSAQAHAVPLTDDMLDVLASLPRFKGKFLFSTTFGESPTWVSDKIKKEIDARMLRTLRAIARKRGDDPSTIELKPWVNHDIRRTVRSNLSRLRVTEEAREAVMAHVRPGIKGVYDHYDYLDEKRDALTLWAARLMTIVEPSPTAPTGNVVSLRA